jgi:acetyl esterase/lipase/catechol 2,3-dioxygenase-like lactoylglutathione lyase family enzyme
MVLALLLVLLLAAGALTAKQDPVPERAKVERNLEYVKDGHERNKLDLYLPEKADGPLPVVVWIHGGYWRRGSKDNCPVTWLVARGYAVASINYRFLQHAEFPAQIEDCKAALRWLRAHAQQYHLDPARVGVIGASAGGHLAALLGTSGGVKDLEGAGGNVDQSSRVQAVIDLFGPVGIPTKNPGGNVLSHISRDTPPFLILHGDADKTVPINHSERLTEALKKAGVEVTFVTKKDAGHGGPAFRDDETRKQYAEFFDKHLKKAVAAANPAPPAAPMPVAHFHHLHLNSRDPAASIEFYTSKFDCQKGRYAGQTDAVWAQKSWLLFTRVDRAPPWELTSAIWHFGWGAEDMKAAYQKQLDRNTRFFTPLTQLGGNFYYAYVQGPDHELIELNTAAHHHFGHLHLFSEDPVTAGEWYMKYCGARRRGTATTPPTREPRFVNGFQVGPSMSLMLDNVNLIIYPIQYSKKAYPDHWKGQTTMSSTAGRVVDHIGISFEDLAAALARMRQDGVKVTEEVRPMAGGRGKSAFIEGPDRIRIELVEGHARQE